MKRSGIMGAILVAIALAAALPADADQEYRATYVLGRVTLSDTDIHTGPVNCINVVWDDRQSGGIQVLLPLVVIQPCIRIEPGDTDVHVRIVDASGRPVGGYLSFSDSSGQERVSVSERSFCDHVVVKIPAGADRMAVTPQGVGFGPAGTVETPCGTDGGHATTGTIVVTFS